MNQSLAFGRMPSSTVENYLKAILRLSDEVAEGALVPVGKIATALSLTPGTVTTMMKHLGKEGYLDYLPRKGVVLTDAGRKAAVQVLRRHRLIELFLVEVMHLDWAHVHEEAEVLEHVLSDRLVERIDEMLGRPAHDPHGDPIPDAKGVMREDQLKNLSECGPGKYQLVRVTRDEPEFLSWLQSQGLRPGIGIDVVNRDPLAGIVEIRVDESKAAIRIGEAVAGVLGVGNSTK
ncbi:metal-dependent transcriptional regulator [Haloferula sp.]|uniref:metal-dependent transcriptional regulator n=1 Tax=Haloferula sp. TaxID=2497595 RepID=UPI00329AA159